MELWTNQGVQQGDSKLEDYAEHFLHLLRRMPEGSVPPPLQCLAFIKGLSTELYPKCKFTHFGKDWTDLDDLIAHCNIQAFLLQSSVAPPPPSPTEGGKCLMIQLTSPPAPRKHAGHHGRGSASQKVH